MFTVSRPDSSRSPSGNGPVKARLSLSSNEVRLVRLANSSGRAPLRALFCRSNCSSALRSPSAAGSVPSKLLSFSTRRVTRPSLLVVTPCQEDNGS